MASLKQNLEKLRVKGIDTSVIPNPYELHYAMIDLNLTDEESADLIGYFRLDDSFVFNN